jgi:hypothetical protein
MNPQLPQILNLAVTTTANNFPIDDAEERILTTARRLYDHEFHPQAMLELWNASANNIKRRIEAYGTDLFISVVNDESGRKNYNKVGDTLTERWEHVDDYVLIQGAKLDFSHLESS